MTVRKVIGCTLVGLAVAPGFAPVLAQPAGLWLDSAVFVERMSKDNVRSLEPASRLARGDRIVAVVNWRRPGGTGPGSFTVVNPLPRSIAYQGSARDDAEVSVDGGRNWGQLGSLQFGDRLATAEDVTHVRWRIQPRGSAPATGQIAYSGIVR